MTGGELRNQSIEGNVSMAAHVGCSALYALRLGGRTEMFARCVLLLVLGLVSVRSVMLCG
jgi:hypothetical protein